MTNLFNYLLYLAGWCALVLGAAAGRVGAATGVALALLLVHLVLARERGPEWRLIAMTGAVGLVVDSAQVAAGLLHFPTGTLVPWLCPPWIVVMWMLFATTFRFSFRWVLASVSRAVLIGAIGGPLAYIAGERLGAVALGEPRALALTVLAVAWAVALPALGGLARGPAGEYRLTE
jgi:hypothetical protein